MPRSFEPVRSNQIRAGIKISFARECDKVRHVALIDGLSFGVPNVHPAHSAVHRLVARRGRRQAFNLDASVRSVAHEIGMSEPIENGEIYRGVPIDEPHARATKTIQWAARL